MTINSFVLIPETTHGSPSGNYDGTSSEFSGTPQKASGYYLGRPAVQTVSASFEDFTGQVLIQGTLEDYANTDDWVTLRTFGETGSVPVENTSSTIIGKFVWIRAVVTGFTGGKIISVNLTY